jgi:hypothetical protein
MFSKVLGSRRPDKNKFFKSSLEWLFFIARKTINETVVLDEIAKYAELRVPRAVPQRVPLSAGALQLRARQGARRRRAKGEADKAFEEVKRLRLMIPEGRPVLPARQVPRGLSYFRENKPEAALESMKEVVRVTRSDRGLGRDGEERNLKNLRELAFMQLARTHYGARQNRYAIFYLSKIERGGPQWLERCSRRAGRTTASASTSRRSAT